MSDVPSEYRYSKSHEWVLTQDDGVAVIGITDHAQDALGDLVFIDLPEIETALNAGDEFGVIESVKAASDLYSPVSGEVVAVNEVVLEDPAIINKDPYGNGWILKIKMIDEAQAQELMEADDYSEFLASE